jgi:hypothetical protein
MLFRGSSDRYRSLERRAPERAVPGIFRRTPSTARAAFWTQEVISPALTSRWPLSACTSIVAPPRTSSLAPIRELFNQGNAALFSATMDALLCFRYDFIGPIAELRCKRPMCIQDLGRGVDFLFVTG